MRKRSKSNESRNLSQNKSHTNHKKIGQEPHGRAPGGGCRAGEPAARPCPAAAQGRLSAAPREPRAGGPPVGGHGRRAASATARERRRPENMFAGGGAAGGSGAPRMAEWRR
jgi:hypothetical protein